MKNMLSSEDMKRFIKKNKVIILVTGIVVFAVYLLFAIYNLYSAIVIEEPDERYQELSQEEIVEVLERDPEEIRAEDLVYIQESLDANSVEFRVFIESQDQTHFNDPALLKDFLVINDVLDYVEEEAGVAIPIDTDLAVLVERRYGHPVLSVNIRTGDYDDNVAIAEAYMSALEEDIVPMIQDRLVYFLDEEPDFFEPRMITQILESLRIYSPLSIIVGSVVAFVAGLVMGVVVAVLKSFKDKKINETTILQKYPEDKVLPLYRLKSDNDINEQFKYAITYPPNKQKVVLSDMDTELFLSNNISSDNIEVVDDIAQANVSKLIDEVIMVVKMDESGRAWYNNQRIQLENVNADIKIILL